MAVQFMESVQADDINIYGGGQAGEYRYDYTVIFDSSQWRVVNFGITVNANQTFMPSVLSTGTVKLITTVDYAGQGTSVGLAWNSLDSSTPKSGNNLKTGLNYRTSGQKIKLHLSYQVPQTVIGPPAICNFSVLTLITFESVVANPTNTPGSTFDPPNVTADGDSPPSGLGLSSQLIIAGAVVLAVVLIARPSAIPTAVRSYRRKG